MGNFSKKKIKNFSKKIKNFSKFFHLKNVCKKSKFFQTKNQKFFKQKNQKNFKQKK